MALKSHAGAKAALNAMTRGLSWDFTPSVRVSPIAPSMCGTDLPKNCQGTERMHSPHPTGRFGRPSEIFGTPLHPATNASGYTTEANIAIGGSI